MKLSFNLNYYYIQLLPTLAACVYFKLDFIIGTFKVGSTQSTVSIIYKKAQLIPLMPCHLVMRVRSQQQQRIPQASSVPPYVNEIIRYVEKHIEAKQIVNFIKHM